MVGLGVGLAVAGMLVSWCWLFLLRRWEMMTTSSSDVSPVSALVVVTSSCPSSSLRHRLRGSRDGRIRCPGLIAKEVDPGCVGVGEGGGVPGGVPGGGPPVGWVGPLTIGLPPVCMIACS